MPGKVLRYRRHPRCPQATTEGAGQVADRIRVRVKRAITNDLTHAPVQVYAWRKTQVNTGGAQFGADQPTGLARQFQSCGGITDIFTADQAHWRYC